MHVIGAAPDDSRRKPQAHPVGLTHLATQVTLAALAVSFSVSGGVRSPTGRLRYCCGARRIRMSWLRTLLSQTTTAFLILAACLSFLTDYPIASSRLEDSVSAIFPVGAALLPYVALVGAVYGGGRVCQWILSRSIDLLRGGPSVRKFRALEVDISNCKNQLISLLEDLRPPSLRYTDASREFKLRTELAVLFGRLRQLSVPAPPLSSVLNEKGRAALVPYLAVMQELARVGGLADARLMALTGFPDEQTPGS